MKNNMRPPIFNARPSSHGMLWLSQHLKVKVLSMNNVFFFFLALREIIINYNLIHRGN